MFIHSVYFELVGIAKEQMTTTWIESTYEPRLHSQLFLALITAQQEGLLSEEINLAIQTGRMLGQAEKEQAKSEKSHAVIESVNQINSPQVRTRQSKHMGLRARQREQSVPIISKHPEPQTSETYPEGQPSAEPQSSRQSVPIVDLKWDDLWRIPLSTSEMDALTQSDLEVIAIMMKQRYLSHQFWEDLKTCTQDVLKTKGVSTETYHLLDSDELSRLPMFYEGESVDVQGVAPFKLYMADGDEIWYPVAFDEVDMFMGVIVNDEVEIGTFSLSNLQQKRGRLGLPVGRDPDYVPTTIQKLCEEHFTRLNMQHWIKL